MKALRPVKIIASGKYLPQKVDSAQIEAKFQMPLGWSEKYSGVKSRHHVTFESNGFMGARALEEAMAKANIEPKDLDLIISAGATFDYPLPNQSCIIKHELIDGMKSSVGTLDIDTTCLSFVTALEIASKLLDGDQYKRIAIVSSEIASNGLNPNNRETLTLFGDGAAAFIVEYDESGISQFIKGGMKTYAEGAYHTIIRGGGNKHYFKDNPYDPELHSFQMNGMKLLRLAKEKGPEFIQWLLDDLGFGPEKIKIVIPHQASKVGLTLFNNCLPFRPEQIKGNLATHGNCIAASIPLVLHENIENGTLKRGDNCMLIGTSAGFSIGGVIFKY